MRLRLLTFAFAMTLGSFMAAPGYPSTDQKSLSCDTCHTCDKPTRKTPCLLECPRHELLTVERSAEESPDTIILDDLSFQFGPVAFSHRLHAAMAELSGGCAICHHHNPELGISPCRACHDRSPRRADLSKPSLKGAYHRQCLSCHREWSHETACAACHALKVPGAMSEGAVDTTDIVGSKHPPILEPTKVVFETESDAGRYVVFYHDDHVQRFEFSCVACHRDDTCSRCHDTARAAVPAMPEDRQAEDRDFDEIHGSCNPCHADSDCDSCHQESPRKPFSHAASANWALGQRHDKVSCRQCHGDLNQFGRLDRDCSACHGDWEVGRFDHGVTGMVLDDIHLELDCDICHKERDFVKTPRCEDCHDEKSFPQDKPGTRLSPE